MRIVTTVFYLLLILVGISFAALNASSVPINFYFKTLSLPISVLIIITFGLGLLVGFSLFFYRYWRLKANCRHLTNQLKLTEKEIKNLRAIPLHDQH
jgi:putative membrane protein